ncbi:MAG: DUF2085 domain-containing protein [Candidatus Eremiobacterota bacterium]
MLDLFLHIWYHFLGYASCHQMIDRTIFFGSRPMFVCVRCSGIYAGYVISCLFIYLTGKNKARFFPEKSVIITGIIISSLIFIDVGSVIAGFRHGANDIRLITGLMAGMSLPFLVFPAINRLLSYNSGEDKKIINGLKPFAGLILLNCLIFFLFKSGKDFLFWPFFLLTGAGFILLYLNLNSILILFFLRLIGHSTKAMLKVIFVSFILSFFELLPVYWLYKFLGIKN